MPWIEREDGRVEFEAPKPEDFADKQTITTESVEFVNGRLVSWSRSVDLPAYQASPRPDRAEDEDEFDRDRLRKALLYVIRTVDEQTHDSICDDPTWGGSFLDDVVSSFLSAYESEDE